MDYIDESTGTFPKTLLIRNTADGMIWQIYHINNYDEAEILSRNARSNGFQSATIVDKTDDQQTWEDWRETCTDELKSVLT